MGQVFKNYLNSSHVYCCVSCNTHLSAKEYVISKNFQGQYGPAYLVKSVINVSEGEPEDRDMLTGVHTACNIMCIDCQKILGWKYIKAFEQDQKFKEGMYILEKLLISRVK
ncbi:yippee-like protein [Conidiobolus coronatus NRRL 28638]|uniref:Protein yippee-like n=1 Tax=Conidiobolus coronatus (strain ATCC 28846 / CBS 209.66 / NRRL 28638) TaxID=796925 RepID=A0A137P9Z3_CONC2|nr:yippee-like protein [Conidiobolus coronatus NRRL 28638]|eukprot:KXN71825.1 yippee-like protein [Conidiobolus coronatus NRRL 28638]